MKKIESKTLVGVYTHIYICLINNKINKKE